MDITSTAPAIFALTIFLLSVAATIVASIVSKQVLADHAEQQAGTTRFANDNVAPAHKATDQDDIWNKEGVRKAA